MPRSPQPTVCSRARAPWVHAELRLLWGLALLLLGCPRPVRSDCGLPPNVPNAQPDLGGSATFSEGHVLTYRCNRGFLKVTGMPDSVTCVNSKWSDLREFCSQSCGFPPRLLFASLKKPYTEQNNFPVGSTVEYQCRLGYRRNPPLLPRLTCLQNLTWSTPAEFCKKKSCPNPGEPVDGQLHVTTDLLFGSSVSFSCNEGFKLIGASTSYCIILDKNVGWSEPKPVCTIIYCPVPPQIENGMIPHRAETYTYGQTATYRCNKGFTLVGERTIYCRVRAEEGEWSGPPPTCRGKFPPPTPAAPATAGTPRPPPPTPAAPTTARTPRRPPPTPAAPTTARTPRRPPPTPAAPATARTPRPPPPTPAAPTPTTGKAASRGTPATPRKPNTAGVPGTEARTQKPTTVFFPPAQGVVSRTTTQPDYTTISKDKTLFSSGSVYFVYGFASVAIVLGILIVIKVFWDYGQSGAYKTHEIAKVKSESF